MPVQSKVSAIVTTYNYARFIAGAIECVLQQTRRPDEIVVVDDGSTDETADIVARYAAQGVRYVYKENGGAGSARNRGIRETTGDLLAFLDADDRWVREKTALQLDHFSRYPCAGLVTGSMWELYEDGRPPLYVGHKPVGAENLYHEVVVENTVGNPSTTMIRRACFERVGLFDETLRLGQDWDMWIRIAREFPIGFTDVPLLYYARHDSSLTAGQVRGRYVSNRLIHSRYIRQERSFFTRLRLLRAAQSMNLFYAAASLMDDFSRRSAAFWLVLAAVLLDPLYKARLKAGLLFRAAFGQAAFDRMRKSVPTFAQSDGIGDDRR